MATWGEIRKSCLSLGFEKDNAYDKNKQSYVDAYNWAQNFLASTYAPIVDFILKTKYSTDTEVIINMLEETSLYAGLAQAGLVDVISGELINGFYITDNVFIHIPQSYTGTLKEYYRDLPAKILTTSDDTTSCEISEKWAAVMPYLMANRLYLDDDASKAGYYWNLFDDMKNQILEKDRFPIASINGGIDVDRWCSV